MADLLLTDIVLPTGERADVHIVAGRIAIVDTALGGAQKSAGGVTPHLAGRGRLLLPGAIDMHVHFRTPGAEHKETLLTGAAAAVKGGVTTCADMPNTSPRTTTLSALEHKLLLAEGAPANVLFNFGAEPDNLEQVRAAAAHPRVAALKIYMGPSTGQGGLPPQHVEAHFRQAAELGLPVMVHAEDLTRIEENTSRFPHDAWHHHLLRGREGEKEAIAQALEWAVRHGTRLYLTHVTQAEAVQMAERSGIRERVFIEACPHHLLLSVDDIAEPVPNRFKVNPPVRTAAERDALFAAVISGGIDGLGSDHAPHTLAEKDAPYDQAPSGIPGVEYIFPLALSWWREGAIDLQRLMDLSAGNAARFFGMPKGSLEPGCDADLVLVDPEAQWRVAEGDDAVVGKCGWTPYAGRTLLGRIEVTIVAGREVWRRPGAPGENAPRQKP